MKCAWNELISILPYQLRQNVDKHINDNLQEIRLRLDRPVELVMGKGNQWLPWKPGQSDLSFVVNTASKYSPWAAASVQNGYITAPGGHRIGICGESVIQNSAMTGFRNVTSLCIRIARDITGIAPDISRLKGSVLILGPPGSGKTTLLRDLIRRISETYSITVVDERGEIFPAGSDFLHGQRTDVLLHCGKNHGITSALRSMGPAWIASDEITAAEDCNAMLQAGWCGVKLLATAHATDKNDLMFRPIYAPLAKSGLFDTLLVLQPDKSWYMERMNL